MIKKIFTLTLLSLATFGAVSSQPNIQVQSPSGKLGLTIGVADNKPFYSVTRGSSNVINPSALGVKYGNDEYFEFDGLADDGLQDIDETYTLGHGKRSTYENRCREQRVTFTNSLNQRQLTLVFRLYDNAVAFRYTKSGTGSFTWDNEQTEFCFANFRKCWVQNSYDAAYSVFYGSHNWADLKKSAYQGFDYGYCVPMLVQTADAGSWCLITESAALSSIAASTLVKGAKTGSVKLEVVKHGNKLGTQETPSTATAPFESPWRTVIIGTLPEIVESTVTQNLSPNSRIGDESWIKPGRVAWNWAAEDANYNLNSEMCRKYTDMAAYFGWEYNLLDEGWDGRLDVQTEANYARQKNVGLILWFNQNHFSSNAQDIYNEMNKYAKMGVKGFKIDFFEDDRQAQLLKYERMLEAAQRLNLLINFHGCTKPSGLDRTWPNLLTMEANYGNEMYMSWPHLTPSYHVVNLALTRNVIGSMDFTPLKWGRHNGSIRSIDNNTWSQELAQCVAYESGLFHPADTPEALEYSVADPVLRNLPVTWDDIRCLEALPDQYVTIARRKGDNWWVGSLANDARTATVTTDYLDEGKEYYAHIYRDGDYRYELKSEVRQGIKKGDKITIPVLKYGGATVIFTTDAAFGYPHDRTFEAEHYNQGGSVQTDSRLFGGKYVSGLGATNTLRFTDVAAEQAGQYAVTLYYRANSMTKVYVQGPDGVKSRLTLEQPGVSEKDHPGENIGFATALVNLNQGLNTIIVGNDQDSQTPMVDHITVRPANFPAARSGEYLTADGKALANAITIEAEDGSGDGTVENDASCSGGKRLNNLTTGKKRTYTVNAEREGIYDFTIFYMTNGARDIEVTANDWTVPLTCYTTGAWNGTVIKTVTAALYLKAGENTFTIGNAKGNAPNVDKIQVAFVTDGQPQQGDSQEQPTAPTFTEDGYVDWCAFLGLDAATFAGARLIQRNGDVYIVAADKGGLFSKTRDVAIVNRSDEQQTVYISGRRLGFEASFTDEATGKALWGLTESDIPAGATVTHTYTGSRLEQLRYEAENARVNDFTDKSLLDASAINASCGFTVSQLGYQPATDGQEARESYIEWNDVYSRQGGEYNLVLDYIASSRRYAELYVNGEMVKRWTNLNSGVTMNALASQTQKVTLKPGANTIRITYPGTGSTVAINVPNIDHITLAPLFNVSGDVTQTVFYQEGKAIFDKAKPLFYNRGSGNDAYQWSSHYQKGSNDRGGVESIWWQGFALATFAEFAKAARGTKDYDDLAIMCPRMANLFPNFVSTVDGRTCWMMRPGYGHRFTDDDAWAGIGLLESYDLEPRQFYIDQLRMFGNWAWSLWDDKGGGGMYWQDAPANDSGTLNVKNAANNNPTCIIFTRLYEITGEQIWLERAIKTYAWVRDVLLDKSDYQVRDNIATKENNKMNNYKGAYNQGSFINASVLLYRATGISGYLTYANNCATRLRANKFQNYKSPVLGKTVSIAKADGDMLGRDFVVIARGFEELNRVSNSRTYIDLVKNTMLNAYGERIDPDCGLMMDGWKGSSPQVYDGKQGYFEGLIQLGFLETFARLAVNQDYEDYVTGISETVSSTKSAPTAVYDLQGRRVAKPGKGLYIMNGKKVIR